MMNLNRNITNKILSVCKTIRNGKNRCFTTKSQYEEVKIPVPWGHVAGKWWGPKDTQPILTLHGWQDNCGSFNRLIPLLLNNDRSFLAIDFPGHGLSSRLPSGLYCHFTNNFILVRYLVKHCKWDTVALMGHSMGGISAFVYTLLYPSEVDFIICLDNFKPMISKDNIRRMANSIEIFPKYSQQEMSPEEPPSYTLEEIKQKISPPPDSSIEYEHSMHIAERNIAPSKVHPGKYYFSRDQRWKLLELMNVPQEDVLEMTKNVKCPVFLSSFTKLDQYKGDDYLQSCLNILKENSIDLEHHKFNETHHFHLNNPEKLAVLIDNFIVKHDCKNRLVNKVIEQ